VASRDPGPSGSAEEIRPAVPAAALVAVLAEMAAVGRDREAGSVSGKLHDGSAYTSQIPTALNDNALSALLLGHKVQVTGISPSTTSVLGVLLEWLLPLLIFVASSSGLTAVAAGSSDGSAGS
jgi:hypothetical protein